MKIHLSSYPNSLRMLLLLIIVGVVLNITNFLFYLLVDVPYRPIYLFNRRFKSENVYSTSTVVPLGEYLWIHMLFNKNETAKTSTTTIEKSYQNGYHLCQEIPEGLGPVQSDPVITSFDGLKNMYFEVHSGGLYVPECESRQSVAILVVFRGNDPLHINQRGRESRVGAFLFYMHPFLMKQKTEYQIFVLHQNQEPYNTGALFNVGFHEVQKLRPGGWSCIIFHDIDSFPCDTRNLYRCSDNPKQMVTTCDSERVLDSHLSRVVAVTPEQFERVLGFSMVEWGSIEPEYEDFYRKLIKAGYKIERNVDAVGNYTDFSQRVLINEDESYLTTKYSKFVSETVVKGPPFLRFVVQETEIHRLFTCIHIHVEFPPVSDDTAVNEDSDIYNNEKVIKLTTGEAFN